MIVLVQGWSDRNPQTIFASKRKDKTETMSKNRTVTIFVVFALLLTACVSTGQVASPALSPVPFTATAVPPSATVTNTATATVTLTATPIPPTFTPTDTSTPTNTPTPELPVGLNTPVPRPSEPITAENASRIVELARYGSPVIWDVQFTGDGAKVFVSTSGGLMVFDAATRERLVVMDVIPRKRSEVSPSWDGSRVMIETDSDIRVYDGDGNLLRVIWEIPEDVLEYSYPGTDLSSSGKLAAVGYTKFYPETYRHNRLFQVFDVDTGEVVFNERGLKPLFSPDGSRMAVHWDGKIMIYDTSTWEKITYLSLWQMEYNSNWEFSPDGSLMAIASPERVEIWDISSRRMVRWVDAYEKDRWGTPARLHWSPDGNLIGINSARIISVWEISTGQLVNSLERGSYWAKIRIDNQGQITTTPVDFNTGGDDLPLPLSWEYRPLRFSENMLFWETAYATRNVFDPVTAACIIQIDGSGYDCALDASRQFIYGDNGQRYAVTDTGDAYRVQNEATGEIVAEIGKKDGYRFAPMQIDDQGFLYAQRGRFGTILYYLNRNENRTLTKTPGGSLWYWAFQPETRRLAAMTTYGGTTMVSGLWLTVVEFGDNGTRTLYRSDAFWQAAPAWNGDVLATIDRRDRPSRLNYLDVVRRKTVLDVETDVSDVEKSIESMRFSSDGWMLAAGTEDGRVFILDAATGAALHVWQAHRSTISAVAFSPDGTMLATMSDDGFVKIWGIWP